MDWSYTQRRKPSEGGDRRSDDRKNNKGKDRLGMLNEFLKESSYAELKRKAENRKEWRIRKPRTLTTITAV